MVANGGNILFPPLARVFSEAHSCLPVERVSDPLQNKKAEKPLFAVFLRF